jgi:hypothetical protein
MADILTKDRISKLLYDYYISHFGASETDTWCEQPAVNVWVFERNGKYISLKAHILTGEIEEFIESK